MSTLPSASVIVCAYTLKRWDDLQDAVESARVQPDASEVVLVIDYNDELLARARERWPDMQVIPNTERQGLSGARNTGVAASSGDVVVFLDDDAEAEPTWLAEILAPFAADDVVSVGGAAVPHWPAGGSGPYTDELLWIVGCSYRGLPTTLAEIRNGIGSSIAFRRAAILAAGGFSLGLGRVGNHPLGCEETELSIKIKQLDPTARILFAPASIIRHRVSKDRVSMEYVRRRSYYEGISKAVLARNVGQSDSLSSESTYLTTVIPKAVLRELGRVGRGGGIRAAAIVVSVLSTVLGYGVGRFVTPKQDVTAAPAARSSMVNA